MRPAAAAGSKRPRGAAPKQLSSSAASAATASAATMAAPPASGAAVGASTASTAAAAAQFYDNDAINLPVARVKKVMRLDPMLVASSTHCAMLANEAPVVMAKAAEMFIKMLAGDAWSITESGARRTLQRSDVTAACLRSEVFDFLVDLLPPGDVPATVVADVINAGRAPQPTAGGVGAGGSARSLSAAGGGAAASATSAAPASAASSAAQGKKGGRGTGAAASTKGRSGAIDSSNATAAAAAAAAASSAAATVPSTFFLPADPQ